MSVKCIELCSNPRRHLRFLFSHDKIIQFNAFHGHAVYIARQMSHVCVCPKHWLNQRRILFPSPTDPAYPLSAIVVVTFTAKLFFWALSRLNLKLRSDSRFRMCIAHQTNFVSSSFGIVLASGDSFAWHEFVLHVTNTGSELCFSFLSLYPQVLPLSLLFSKLSEESDKFLSWIWWPNFAGRLLGKSQTFRNKERKKSIWIWQLKFHEITWTCAEICLLLKSSLV